MMKLEREREREKESQRLQKTKKLNHVKVVLT